jgi:hypothetical protein
MAIIRFSPLIGGISGALGGLVFSASPQGAVVKHRALKLQKTSARAFESAALAINVTRAWANLSDEQRIQWNFAASHAHKKNRLGVQRAQSGYTLFMSANLKRRNFTVDRAILEEPDPDPPLTVTAISVNFEDGGPYSLSYTQSGAPFLPQLLVYGSRSFRANNTAGFSFERLVFRGSGGVSGANVFTSWSNALGELELGERFRVRLELEGTTAFANGPTILTGTVQP